ncbi:hypothetical protein N7539_004326 [Penicillium diatomitis]|uniref:Uncharacterized protein n=1 Tax=Penicillium diatomitis TaxID=2819901 RepID=A0A9W9XDX0_9EURO|nr:uncharacterized protein N7539_004326 [Penicillium diatomitis]KAJ5489436.1 hypothetical protein N7539_004326 [Penicillium diatomitis]
MTESRSIIFSSVQRHWLEGLYNLETAALEAVLDLIKLVQPDQRAQYVFGKRETGEELDGYGAEFAADRCPIWHSSQGDWSIQDVGYKHHCDRRSCTSSWWSQKQSNPAHATDFKFG